MRRWFVALCLVGLTPAALAGEFELPTLRGSSPFIPAAPTYTRWSGFYAGGQLGRSSANMDFINAFDGVNIFDITNPFSGALGSVSAWAGFGRNDHRGTSYGGFIGYNTQWDDAILGIEINYNRSRLFGSSTDARCYSNTNPQCFASLTLGDSNAYDVTIDAAASARITDYGTLRGRAGWAYGNFLPYAVFGLAVARAALIRSATADATPVGAGTAFVLTESDQRTRYVWGYTFGGGIEFLIMPNAFVRAEYEFVQLNPVGDIKLNISTARVGGGLKF